MEREFLSRVFFRQELQGFLVRHVQVDLGGGDRAVAQEFLDEPQVHALFQQHGREGVPEGVGCDVPLDPSEIYVLFHHVTGGLGGKRVPSLIHEEVRVFEAEFPAHPLVLLQCPKHRLVPEKYHSFLIAFPHDPYGIMEKVHIVILHITEFMDPNAAGKEHLDHQNVSIVKKQGHFPRPPAGTPQAFLIYRRQDPVHFLFCHGGGEPEGFFDSDPHPDKGVLRQKLLFFRPIQEPPQGRDLPFHGPDRIFLVQQGNVLLENRLRDGSGGKARLQVFQKRFKMLQIQPVRFHRILREPPFLFAVLQVLPHS